ncbi:hypothetical protein SprV_0501898600 [Sparganum proliferum]
MGQCVKLRERPLWKKVSLKLDMNEIKNLLAAFKEVAVVNSGSKSLLNSDGTTLLTRESWKERIADTQVLGRSVCRCFMPYLSRRAAMKLLCS